MDLCLFTDADIEQMVSHVQNSGVLICPTNTIWGMHACADDHIAVEKVQELKGRPADKPCVLLMADQMMALRYVQLCPIARHLLKHFPHQITLLVPRQAKELSQYFPNYQKLAFRITPKGLLQKIIRHLDTPLLSTSVNKSGQQALNTIPEMIEVFATDDCLLAQATEQQAAALQLPSTIVEIAAGRLKIHREGSVTKQDLQTTMRHFIQV